MSTRTRLAFKPTTSMCRVEKCGVKRLADGAAAVGLFSPGKATSRVAVTWTQAGVSGPAHPRSVATKGPRRVRWPVHRDGAGHGVVLVKLTAAARLAAARPKPTSGDLMAKMIQTWETIQPWEALMAGPTDGERP